MRLGLALEIKKLLKIIAKSYFRDITCSKRGFRGRLERMEINLTNC
jgi:hypothetical protein